MIEPAPEEAVRASRLLFATWQGGGNATAILELAARLASRGHRVRVLVPESLREAVEEAGCEAAVYRAAAGARSSSSGFDPYRPSPPASGPLGRLRRRVALAPGLAFAGSSLEHAEDVLAEIGRFAPDAAAVDYMLAGAIAAAERAGLPTAVLVHTVYPFPTPGGPPFGWGLRPARGPAGLLRDELLVRGGRRAGMRRLRALNEARRRLGLDPVASAAEQAERAGRLLVFAPAGFDLAAARVPENVRYVGAQHEPPATPPFAFHGPGKPLVLASFSTYLGDRPLTQAVLDALGGLPVRALLTAGAQPPAALRVPANVGVIGFVPHGDVMPEASAVVTHGGLGTITAALAHGLPLLCLPLRADQPDNAVRVVLSGAGLRLAPRAGARRIRRAVVELLGNPSYRVAASRLAHEIAATGPDAGARELEALAGYEAIAASKRASSSSEIAYVCASSGKAPARTSAA